MNGKSELLGLSAEGWRVARLCGVQAVAHIALMWHVVMACGRGESTGVKKSTLLSPCL